jgi:hypothetical protein
VNAYVHAVGGLGPGGRVVGDYSAAGAERLAEDARPVPLRDLGKTLGCRMPRLASRFAELAVIGASCCLRALATPLATETPLYLATGLGDVARTDELYYQVMPPSSEMAAPAQFATSGNNMAAFFVAQQAQLRSRNMTLSLEALSLEQALALALRDLAVGGTASALVGAVDETTVPREFYVRRFALAEHELIGEGSAWCVLRSEPAGACGEIVGAAVLPPRQIEDENAWAEVVLQAAETFHLPAPTLLSGCRLTTRESAALRQGSGGSAGADYLACTGYFPTAAGLGMASTFYASVSSDRSFLHVNRDQAGRTGLIAWRVYAGVGRR